MRQGVDAMMSLLDGFEARMASLIGNEFDQADEAQVQPVELAAALQREMDDAATTTGGGPATTVNAFLIDLSTVDLRRLASHLSILTTELAAVAAGYADDQGYRLAGRPVVRLQEDAILDIGVFRVTPFAAPQARPTSPAAEPPLADPTVSAAEYPPSGGSDSPYGDSPYAQQLAPHQPAPHQPAPHQPASHQPPEPDGIRPVAAGHHAPPPTTRGWPDSALTPGAGPAHPDSRGRPRVVINGVEHILVLRENIIGRGEGADLRISDPAVSRAHVRLSIGETIEVADLGSTNGTRVNGVPQSHAVLTNGDVIDIGATRMVVRTD